MYAVVAHFATGPDMDRWLSSDVRAKLVAEADLHSAGGLRTRYLSGLEGWLAQPGSPVVLPVARWKIIVLSMAGITPLLEAVSYLLVPHLAGVPGYARPLISASILIPLMQYAVMPTLTRVTHGFLYPEQMWVAPGAPRDDRHGSTLGRQDSASHRRRYRDRASDRGVAARGGRACRGQPQPHARRRRHHGWRNHVDGRDSDAYRGRRKQPGRVPSHGGHHAGGLRALGRAGQQRGGRRHHGRRAFPQRSGRDLERTGGRVAPQGLRV